MENTGESRQPAHSEAQEPAAVPQKDTTPAAPVDASPDSAQGTPVPESQTPATPANEEAEAASGQPQQDDDSAPDADEPGDATVPDEELASASQEQPDQPDEVDREG